MRPERYWLSSSRMKVVDAWIGGEIARVVASTQPRACAASDAGCTERSVLVMGGLCPPCRARGFALCRVSHGRGCAENAPGRDDGEGLRDAMDPVLGRIHRCDAR